jgi:hypothetical protein
MKRLFLILLLTVGAYADQIVDSFEKQGYYELLNENMGSSSFDLLYEEYDYYIEQENKNPTWSGVMASLNKEYSKILAPQIHSSPLIGYRSEHCTPGLVSFYYSEDYHKFLLKHPRYKEIGSEKLEAFLNHLHLIWENLHHQMEQIINDLENSYPIKKVLYNKDNKLLFQVKVLRYIPSKPVPIRGHFDFTGLTFLVDNNEGNKESLLLSPFRDSFSVSDFLPPNRYIPRQATSSSILLIPGAFLKYCKLPINPTAHLILKSPHVRYSIVAFALLPKHNIFNYDEITLPTPPKISYYNHL